MAKKIRLIVSSWLFRVAYWIMPPTNYIPPTKVEEEKIVKGYGA